MVSISTVVGVNGALDVAVVVHGVVGLVLAYAALGGPIDRMHTRMRTRNISTGVASCGCGQIIGRFMKFMQISL